MSRRPNDHYGGCGPPPHTAGHQRARARTHTHTHTQPIDLPPATWRLVWQIAIYRSCGLSNSLRQPGGHWPFISCSIDQRFSLIVCPPWFESLQQVHLVSLTLPSFLIYPHFSFFMFSPILDVFSGLGFTPEATFQPSSISRHPLAWKNAFSI